MVPVVPEKDPVSVVSVSVFVWVSPLSRCYRWGPAFDPCIHLLLTLKLLLASLIGYSKERHTERT